MAPLQWPSDALRPFPSSFTPLRDALSFPSTPRAVISTKKRRKKKKKSRGSGTQSPILLSLCLWPCNPSTLLQLTLQVRGSSPGRLGGSILQTTREGRNDPSLSCYRNVQVERFANHSLVIDLSVEDVWWVRHLNAACCDQRIGQRCTVPRSWPVLAAEKGKSATGKRYGKASRKGIIRERILHGPVACGRGWVACRV